MRTIPPHNPQPSRRPLRWLKPLLASALALCMAFGAAHLLLAEQPAAAAPHSQEHPAAAKKHIVRRTTRRRAIAARRRHPAHRPAQVASALLQPSVPAVPVAPPAPLWPAKEKPSPATVTWDSHGLSIDAANSSLAQILHDVSVATGAKVEGFNSDERIFGNYGPGPERDVLFQLLVGSGYNIVMIGDQATGTPLTIVLSPRTSGPAQPSANQPSDDDTPAYEQQAQPPPYRTGFGPGDRFSPQDRMRQMEMRNRGQQQPPPQPDNPQL